MLTPSSTDRSAELPISLASGYRTPLPSARFLHKDPEARKHGATLSLCFVCFFHSLLPVYLSQGVNFPLIPALDINFLFANGCTDHPIFGAISLSAPTQMPHLSFIGLGFPPSEGWSQALVRWEHSLMGLQEST